MSGAPSAYDAMREAVARGLFVGCAPGTVDGKPVLAVNSAIPGDGSAPYMLDPCAQARAAFAVGYLMSLRRAFARRGVQFAGMQETRKGEDE